MIERRCRVLTPGGVALTALTAVWIGLGHLHEFQNSDSIVPVLVSLQRWTPFYWSQDRFGMLVPLLTFPIRHPLANLIAQAMIDTFAGLLASFLVLRYLLGSSPAWMAAAALQNSCVLLLAPRLIQFHWFVAQAQYGLSTSLGVGALMIRYPPLAVAAMLLAHWVNVMVFVVLVPLACIRYLIDHERQHFVWSLLSIALGAILGGCLMVASPYRVTSLAIEPPSQWVYGWARLLERAQEHVVPQPLVVLWLLLPAGWALWCLLQSRRTHVPAVASGLVLTAVLNWLAVGTSSWVRTNMYSPGYLIPTMLLVTTALAALVVAPFERLGRWIAVGAGVVMLGAAGFTSGWPSVATVQHEVDTHLGKWTPDILSSGAIIVAGDYWSVWPAVFHANLTAYQGGVQRQFYGSGYRDDATRSTWPQPHRIYVIK